MFFGRTEKSGKQTVCEYRIENGKEIAICKIVIFQKFWNWPPLNWTFLNVVVVDTDNHNDKYTLQNHTEISNNISYILYFYAVVK